MCATVLTDDQFQAGKMCCDKPMFHDDHDEEDHSKTVCDGCNQVPDADGPEELIQCDMCQADLCNECFSFENGTEEHDEQCDLMHSVGSGCGPSFCKDCFPQALPERLAALQKQYESLADKYVKECNRMSSEIWALKAELEALKKAK